MSKSKEVTVGDSLAVKKTARLSPLGFFMALPPVLVILFFIGGPILLAFSFTLGFTTGPNEIVALIGQEIYTKTNWWGTLEAYKSVFSDSRFPGNLKATLEITFVATTLVIVLALGMAIYQRIIGGRLATILVALSLVPLFMDPVSSQTAPPASCTINAAAK